MVLLVVLWRLCYKLSLQDLAAMFLTRGFTFTGGPIRRGDNWRRSAWATIGPRKRSRPARFPFQVDPSASSDPQITLDYCACRRQQAKRALPECAHDRCAVSCSGAC